jgi:ribosomal protein S18 acetylase RimI-like enzyme
VTILVRDASEADIDSIAKVHVQGWRESYAGILSAESLDGMSVEERAQMWQGAFANPDPRAKFLIGEMANGEIVGFARGGPTRSKGRVPLDTDAEIHAIYLLGSVKRQGLGRRLMMGVFDHLAQQGFRSAGLWVLKDNLPARCFYEALGGQPGPEQSVDLRGQVVTEIAYRFEPIPRMG